MSRNEAATLTPGSPVSPQVAYSSSAPKMGGGLGSLKTAGGGRARGRKEKEGFVHKVPPPNGTGPWALSPAESSTSVLGCPGSLSAPLAEVPSFSRKLR